jgi:hypothetical protein
VCSWEINLAQCPNFLTIRAADATKSSFSAMNKGIKLEVEGSRLKAERRTLL